MPGEADLQAFKRFCAEELTTDLGEPLVIEPFQDEIVAPFLAGCRTNIAILPKKQGKSSLCGAVGLFTLCSLPDCSIAVVASARDQAQYVLDQARLYVRRNPRLRERLRIVERAIHHRTLGGKMLVRASDSDSLDGWIGDVAICDELGRWSSFENLYLLRDGLGPRRGRMLGISTAGADLESPLGEMRSEAHALAGFTREGCRNCVRTDNLSFNEWCLADGEDVDDLDLVKQANPLKGMTLEELRMRRESSPDWVWRRFACGQWGVVGEDSAISPTEWADCARPGQDIPEGAEGVVVGIDLGWRWDTTAMVPVWRKSEGAPIVVGRPQILTPPGDGRSLDAEDVFETARSFAQRWPEVTFVLDPRADGEQLAQRLDRELRARVMTHSQSHTSMAAASELLRSLVAEGALQHPDDEELTRHVLAAVPRELLIGWRLSRPKGKNLPIDGSVALAMAVRVLNAMEAKPVEPRSDVRVDLGAVVYP